MVSDHVPHLVANHGRQCGLGLGHWQQPGENHNLAVRGNERVGFPRFDDHRFPVVLIPKSRRINDPLTHSMNAGERGRCLT